jgi:MFS family permease
VLNTLTAFVAWRGHGLAMVIPQLWLIRAAFGMIAAPMYPTSGRTVAVTTSPVMQARANSLVLSSVGAGSVVAPVLLAPVANSFGSRAAMIVAASFSAAAGLLWFRFPPRQLSSNRTTGVETSVTTCPAASSPKFSVRPLRSPAFWFLCGS